MIEKTHFLRLMDELLELAPGTLTGAESLKSMELWDSVALISFMVMIKENFRITIAPKEAWTCPTVNDLFALATRSTTP